MYFAGSTGTAVSDWISLSEGLKYMCLLIHIVLVGRSSETLWNHKLYFILFDWKKKALHFHELIAFQDAHVIQSLGYFPSWILAAIGRESIVLVKRIFQSRPLFAISRFIWWGMESGTRLIDWSDFRSSTSFFIISDWKETLSVYCFFLLSPALN
jgi:hypothetical protein